MEPDQQRLGSFSVCHTGVSEGEQQLESQTFTKRQAGDDGLLSRVKALKWFRLYSGMDIFYNIGHF